MVIETADSQNETINHLRSENKQTNIRTARKSWMTRDQWMVFGWCVVLWRYGEGVRNGGSAEIEGSSGDGNE